MGSSKQSDDLVVRGRGRALRRMYNQLRLNPATLQLGGDCEVNYSFRMRCAVEIILEDQVGEARSLELDMDRTGAKRDAVNEAVQQLAVALRLITAQVGCGRRCVPQDRA